MIQTAVLKDEQKILARQLARKILSGDPYDFFEVPESRGGSLPETLPQTNTQIGIWKLTADGNTFERGRDRQQEWHYWSDTPSFPRQSETTRIVLTGESVARGFLYDPFYNPAISLGARLADQSALSGVEVVDLARNGMDLQTLEQVCTGAMALAPAALIVFAGNNWLTSLLNDGLSPSTLQVLHDAARNEEHLTFKQVMEAELEKRIRAFMQRLHIASEEQGTAVIFVMPAYNLLDWKSSSLEQKPKWFSKAGAEEWAATADAGRAAVVDQDYTKAGIAGARLIQMDPTNPLGYEVSAEHLLHQKEYVQAHALLQKALDTAIYGRANSCGRNLGISRTLVKELSRTYGFQLVDLEEVFLEHNKGELPGRTLFLDYCHMTIEGIELTTERLLQALVPGVFKIPVSGLEYTMPKVSGDQRGMAHVFAAIHNAHHGQSAAIVTHHCLEAVKSGTQPARFMTLYAALASRKISNVLCRHYTTILSEGMAAQYSKGHLLLHPKAEKSMDRCLVHAMIYALQQAGIDIEKQVNELRIREHACNHEVTDLLASYYNLPSYEDTVQPKAAYYKELRNVSRFYPVVNQEGIGVVHFCGRLPGVAAGSIVIRCNNKQVLECNITGQWSMNTFEIPADVMQQGINEIVLEWPAVGKPLNFKGQSREATLTMADLHTEMYPIAGHISLLTLTIIRS